MNRALILTMALALTGCISAPDRVDSGWSHTSHPRLGWPFGPASDEDTLDVADTRARWKRGRYNYEISLGYRLADNGFYGDDFIFHSRVSVDLWSK